MEDNGGGDAGGVKGVMADTTQGGAGSSGEGASGVAGLLMGTWVRKTIASDNSSLPLQATTNSTASTTMTAHASVMGVGPASGASALAGEIVSAEARGLAAGDAMVAPGAGVISNAAAGVEGIWG